jgi:transposase InsO family protein
VSRVSNDDVLYGYRLRLFALAGEIGVRPACRAGIHHSTYYRWKAQVERWGLEALRVRERRRPRMPNALGPHLEQRIIAFALGHPGLGPKRIAAELAREKWGGLRISANGIWRVLKRHGLNTRTKRLSLIAGDAARYERRPEPPEPERHVEAAKPGELVGLDCFSIGRLSGTKGAVWQYTAIDVASGFAWAELHTSPKNPAAKHCSALVARVASELARAGWRLQAVISDNGSEFRSGDFSDRLSELVVEQRRIRAGRPTSNGHVERLQQTILEECWRPSFARSLVPKLTALERDLKQYLGYYNFDRAHTGRLTRGRIPGEIVYGARKVRTAR